MFRQMIAPLVLRFKDTDALLDTMSFFGQFEDVELEPDLREMVDRGSMQVARELVRRKVRFWEMV
jgi:hypothetical protein